MRPRPRISISPLHNSASKSFIFVVLYAPEINLRRFSSSRVGFVTGAVPLFYISFGDRHTVAPYITARRTAAMYTWRALFNCSPPSRSSNFGYCQYIRCAWDGLRDMGESFVLENRSWYILLAVQRSLTWTSHFELGNHQISPQAELKVLTCQGLWDGW